MLKAEERSILFTACAGHPVASCNHCLRGFRPDELGYHLRAPMQGFLCPECRRDVTASVSTHVSSCPAFAELHGRKAG
jgi:transposase-like protein